MRSVNCGLCGNNCQLTVNIFPGGKKYISGNRCDRPVSHRGAENPLNLYEYKQRLLAEYKPQPQGDANSAADARLGMYELLPFWYAFFTKLGFSVVTLLSAFLSLFRPCAPVKCTCFYNNKLTLENRKRAATFRWTPFRFLYSAALLK